MPLVEPAAIVISFDIEPASVAEHDAWHSQEHMPERLSIPGFRRGTRWCSNSSSPRYLVVYEVADTSVMNSGAYLERLNNPTPWTTLMMKSYRNMARGLCSVIASSGQGLGGWAYFARIAAPASRDARQHRQSEDVLSRLATRPGIVAAHLMEATIQAPMTTEQQIRGNDAGMRFALLVTGYDSAAIATLLESDLPAECLGEPGDGDAPPVVGIYGLAATLTHEEAHPTERAVVDGSVSQLSRS